jgi:pimeloyl-ACP methyl ester carboxylesterase
MDEADQTTTVPDEATTSDGRRLHLERSGTGMPTVVLEAGLGMSRSMWGAVVPLLSGRTEVVAYDRAGTGRSPAAPPPRDLVHLADDLVAVLDHLGPGPYVLVGHSWGGPIVRQAAAKVPSRIAGLVLVDQTDEGCDLFFEKGNERQTAFARKVVPLAARLGLLRLAMKRAAKPLPEASARAMAAEDGTVAAARAQGAELEHHVEDLRRLRDHPLTLPDVPVTVISGTKAGRMERGRRTELLVAHRALAASLPQGRAVDADESGHLVPFSEPQLVADEVLRIVDGIPGAA